MLRRLYNNSEYNVADGPNLTNSPKFRRRFHEIKYVDNLQIGKIYYQNYKIINKNVGC